MKELVEQKKIANSVSFIVKEANTIEKVENDEDNEYAADISRRMKTMLKTADDERKKATKPLDEAKKVVMGWFNPLKTLIGDECDRLRKEMTSYFTKKENARLKKERELQEQAKKDAPEEEVAFTPTIPKTQAPEGISYKDKWTMEIFDKTLVPEQYKIIDHAMLNQIAQVNKGEVSIGGCKVIHEKIQSTRRG